MGMYAKVRRLFYREQLSINEIKRQTSLSRNTIKKWLKPADGIEPKYQRRKLVGKLAAFESQLKLALQADTHRIKRERRTGLMHFNALKLAGFTGSYSSVNRYIHGWHDQVAKVTGKSAFVPLKFQLNDLRQSRRFIAGAPQRRG